MIVKITAKELRQYFIYFSRGPILCRNTSKKRRQHTNTSISCIISMREARLLTEVNTDKVVHSIKNQTSVNLKINPLTNDIAVISRKYKARHKVPSTIAKSAGCTNTPRICISHGMSNELTRRKHTAGGINLLSIIKRQSCFGKQQQGI